MSNIYFIYEYKKQTFIRPISGKYYWLNKWLLFKFYINSLLIVYKIGKIGEIALKSTKNVKIFKTIVAYL